MNKAFVEDLIKLIQENPDMEIKCEVDSDIVADDRYAWWLGNLNTNNHPRIEEYSTNINESLTYKSDDDYEEWFEDLFNIDDYSDILDDKWDDFIKEKVDKEANWKKAIFIRVQVD